MIIFVKVNGFNGNPYKPSEVKKVTVLSVEDGIAIYDGGWCDTNPQEGTWWRKVDAVV